MKSDRELLEGILLGKTEDLADAMARASFDEKRRPWRRSPGRSSRRCAGPFFRSSETAEPELRSTSL